MKKVLGEKRGGWVGCKDNTSDSVMRKEGMAWGHLPPFTSTPSPPMWIEFKAQRLEWLLAGLKGQFRETVDLAW